MRDFKEFQVTAGLLALGFIAYSGWKRHTLNTFKVSLFLILIIHRCKLKKNFPFFAHLPSFEYSRPCERKKVRCCPSGPVQMAGHSSNPQQAKPTLLRIPAETFSRSLLVMLVMLMMLILILLILGEADSDSCWCGW